MNRVKHKEILESLSEWPAGAGGNTQVHIRVDLRGGTRARAPINSLPPPPRAPGDSITVNTSDQIKLSE